MCKNNNNMLPVIMKRSRCYKYMLYKEGQNHGRGLGLRV